MRNARATYWYGVRLPMIAPVMAMPGQTLWHSWGGDEPDVVQVLEFDRDSRARILRTGVPTAGDDIALLEEDGIIVRLQSAEELKRYGYDAEKRRVLTNSRKRSRARTIAVQANNDQVTA